MRSSRLRSVLLIVFFLLGLLIALYPTISTRWNEYRDAQLVTHYDNSLRSANADEKTKNEQALEAARQYNQTLNVPSVPDAFSVRDGLQDTAYESLLNTSGTGMIGYVEIPCIEVKLPIYHYTTDEVLLKGAGHLLGSALPVGGLNTHCVVSAHRGLPNAKMFQDLNLLEVGDVFYFHVLGEICAYEVDQVLVVEPSEVESLSVSAGMDYATLVTCTPYAVNTHRLLVRGHRIEYSEESYEESVSQVLTKSNVNYIVMNCLCVGLGIAIAVLIVSIVERRSARKAGHYRHEKKGAHSRE